MNILQINTFDTGGGAANVAYGLHGFFRNAGHNSKMLVGIKTGNDPDVMLVSKGHAFYNRVRGLGKKRLGLQYFFNTSARGLMKLDIVRNADIIHVHNSHGDYLNLWAVGKLSMVKPVVWTLHDMWAFTGHCAHSFECERWKTGCGDCPGLYIYPAIKMDTTRLLWKIKSRIYRNSRVTITVPSKWLMDYVAGSMLSHAPAYLIPNAVNTEVFKPGDRGAIRAALGIPQDRFVLTFTADYGAINPFKGFKYLVEALNLIKTGYRLDPYLLVIGARGEFSMESLGFDGKNVGFIKDPALMAEYNSASDAYVVPSLAENSPLVVIESLACGVPVVAFKVGGIPELIKHKETGYLAKYKDSSDIAEGIKWLMELDADKRQRMRRSCVQTVNEKHTLRQQAESFLNLYERLMRA